MALWIGNQISGADGLFYSDKQTLEKKGAKVHMETEITNIDFDKKVVYGKNRAGEEIEESYDKLILATGSKPIVPNIPGKDLDNVQQVKLYQDAKEVIKKLADDDIKDVTIVGAGYIGVELAEAFQRHGKKVRMIDMAPTCLANYYDLDFSKLMEENLRSKGIDLHFNEMVEEIQGEGKVERLITNNNEYETDMVILSIGFRPNTEIGQGQIETFRNGAYVVNKKQETNMKDVYAIGDCATIYDNSIEDTNYIALASNAVRSGIVAGHNAAGGEIESEGVQGSNGINIYDLKMVSTGLSLQAAEKRGFNVDYTDFTDTQKAGFMEIDNPEVKIRIVYDKDTRVILGAQMASEHDMSMGIHMFSLAVQEKVTIDKLALLDIFFLP